MSDCWKCGKKWPGTQVECEDGCGSSPLGKLPNTSLTDIPIIVITLTLDVPTVVADREGYIKSVERFNNMLQEAVVISGLVKFAKKD